MHLRRQITAPHGSLFLEEKPWFPIKTLTVNTTKNISSFFFLRKHCREKIMAFQIFIYSRNVQLFLPAWVYWQFRTHPNNTVSHKIKIILFFLSEKETEKYVFRKLSFKSSDRKSNIVATSFHFWEKNVVGTRGLSAGCGMPRSASTGPALPNLRRPQENTLPVAGLPAQGCSCTGVRSTLEKCLVRLCTY